MKAAIHNAVTRLIEADVREVVLPGEDGELSVWNFHQNCLYSLRAGQVRLTFTTPQDNKTMNIPIKKGLAIIENDKISILVEE